MSKFKVGDKVKIVGNSNPMHHFAIGDVVDVTSLSGYGEYGEIELRGRCAWQEPGETSTQYLSMSDIEPVTPTTTFTIGQTYKTASGRDVTCIALREDGGMFGVFGTDRTSAYGWDGEGNYLCAVSSECPPYRIVFEPVVEWVHEDRELYGIHLNIAFQVVDGVPDWSRAVVTPCT